MNLLHIKLKNGQDLLAQEERSTDTTVTIAAPVVISIDPSYGIMGTNWCHLSSISVVELKKEDILFCYPASERGYKYYDEFAHKFIEEDKSDDQLLDESISELEELFTTMLESKNSTKH